MKVTFTQDGVAVPEVLLAREQDKNQLALASRQGSLTRIRRGAYCDPDDIRADGPASAPREKRNRELARARALHRQLRSNVVFSHTTAALLLGCPVWTVPDRTHVYQRYRPSSRAAKDIARHVGTVPAYAVTTVHGLPVTSLVRTVVDCALALHPLEALVIADFALSHDIDRAELLVELGARAERRGVRRARLVLELADGGSHSPWETWVRYEMLRSGLPRPVTQMAVPTDSGLFHTDLGYEQWNLGVEFDGLIKYRPDGVGTGHDPAREFMSEKGRAEAIRRTGVAVERVTASDRRDVPSMLARLTAHLPPHVLQRARVNPLLPPS
ncbi:hypothetical protein [Promicromonospora sp. MEB111]|uniref:hypothetical protein n=1 Tax=unclassified Promicromonospora TaxID=2647929 RepID=UPI00254A5D12|nr:hypothetical protein [Promicromonospora sp. MEB111]